MHKTTSIILGAFFLAVAATGCGTVSEESTGTLRGQLTNERSNTVQSAHAAVIWLGEDDNGDVAIGQSIAVSGNFPASFEMVLEDAPPAQAVFPLQNGVGISIAFIGALNEPFTSVNLTNDNVDGLVFGLSEGHVLLYAENDLSTSDLVDVDGDVIRIVKDDLTAGYNLMRVAPKTPEQLAEITRCQEQADGFEEFDACGSEKPDLFRENDQDTPVGVRLVDDLDDLEIPNID